MSPKKGKGKGGRGTSPGATASGRGASTSAPTSPAHASTSAVEIPAEYSATAVAVPEVPDQSQPRSTAALAGAASEQGSSQVAAPAPAADPIQQKDAPALISAAASQSSDQLLAIRIPQPPAPPTATDVAASPSGAAAGDVPVLPAALATTQFNQRAPAASEAPQATHPQTTPAPTPSPIQQHASQQASKIATAPVAAPIAAPVAAATVAAAPAPAPAPASHHVVVLRAPAAPAAAAAAAATQYQSSNAASDSSGSDGSDSDVDVRDEAQVLGQMGAHAGMHAHSVHANALYSTSSSNRSLPRIGGETPTNMAPTSRLAVSGFPAAPQAHAGVASALVQTADQSVKDVSAGPEPALSLQLPPDTSSSMFQAPPDPRSSVSAPALPQRSPSGIATISFGLGMAGPSSQPENVSASASAVMAGSNALADLSAANASSVSGTQADMLTEPGPKLPGARFLLDSIGVSDQGSPQSSQHVGTFPLTPPSTSTMHHGGQLGDPPQVVHLANLSGPAVAAALRTTSMGGQSTSAMSMGGVSATPPPVVYVIETMPSGASASSAKPPPMSVAQLYSQATDAAMNALHQAGGHAGGLPPTDDESQSARRKRSAQQRERAAAASLAAQRQSATSRENLATAAAASFRKATSSDLGGSSQARGPAMAAAAAAAVAAVPATVVLPSGSEEASAAAPGLATSPLASGVAVSGSSSVAASGPSGLPPRPHLRRSGTGLAVGAVGVRTPPLQISSIEGASVHGGSQYSGSGHGGTVYYVQVPAGVTGQAAITAAQAAVANAQAQAAATNASQELPFPLTIEGSIPSHTPAASQHSSLLTGGGSTSQQQPIIVTLPPNTSPRTADEITRLVSQISSRLEVAPAVSPREGAGEGLTGVMPAVPAQPGANLVSYSTLMAEQHAGEVPPEGSPRGLRDGIRHEQSRRYDAVHGEEGGRDTAGGPRSPASAEGQLQTLALFNNDDDDDDERGQHHVQKVFSSGHKWWKQKYWIWFMVTQAIGLILFIIGIILHTEIDNSDNHANTEAFRWFYFLALMPTIWFAIDISCYYLFRWIEWYFFRESLLYLEHVQRNTITFLFIIALLPWYNAMFVWAWCQNDNAARCEVDAYSQAVTIQWRVMLCVMLFTLANVLDSVAAKLLSLHFYRNAHFQKLQAALEKEYFLQVLSRPHRKVVAARKAEEEAADLAHFYDKQESTGLGKLAISRFFSTFGSSNRRVASTLNADNRFPKSESMPEPHHADLQHTQSAPARRLEKRSHEAGTLDRHSLSFKLPDPAAHLGATPQEAYTSNYNMHMASTHGPAQLPTQVEPPAVDEVHGKSAAVSVHSFWTEDPAQRKPSPFMSHSTAAAAAKGTVVPGAEVHAPIAVRASSVSAPTAAGAPNQVQPSSNGSGRPFVAPPVPPAPPAPPPAAPPLPSLDPVMRHSGSGARTAAGTPPGVRSPESTGLRGSGSFGSSTYSPLSSRLHALTHVPTAAMGDVRSSSGSAGGAPPGGIFGGGAAAMAAAAAAADAAATHAQPSPAAGYQSPVPIHAQQSHVQSGQASPEPPTYPPPQPQGTGPRPSAGQLPPPPQAQGMMSPIPVYSPPQLASVTGPGVTSPRDVSITVLPGPTSPTGSTLRPSRVGSLSRGAPLSLTPSLPPPPVIAALPLPNPAAAGSPSTGTGATTPYGSGAATPEPGQWASQLQPSSSNPGAAAGTQQPSLPPSYMGGARASLATAGSQSAPGHTVEAVPMPVLPAMGSGTLPGGAVHTASGTAPYSSMPGSTTAPGQSILTRGGPPYHSALSDSQLIGMHSAPPLLGADAAAAVAPVHYTPPPPIYTGAPLPRSSTMPRGHAAAGVGAQGGGSAAHQALTGSSSGPPFSGSSPGQSQSSTGDGQANLPRPSTPPAAGGEGHARAPTMPAISESRPASVADMPRGAIGRASQDSKAVRPAAGSTRAGGSVKSGAERSRPSFSHPLGPMGEAIIETVPLQSKGKKDPALMTELELEKVRTAVVIKTYTAIIRNYASMTPEQQGREMVQVRTFSRALFHNIRGESDLPFITLESFELFFSDKDNAMRAFSVFDTNGDGRVSKREVREAVEAIYRERANMAAALKDTDSIVKSMEFAIGGVVHFVFCAFYLLIWQVDLVQGFSAFSATLLAFTFMFGNAVKNMFESMLFLFVEHAYDVGDNILINGEIYRVKKITLLYTEMVQVNGERIFWPNAELINTVISNYTRTRTKTEFILVQVDIGVPPHIVADIMNSMREHSNAHPTEYDGAPFVQYRNMADNLKVVLMVSWTYAFPPDDWKRLVPARNAMFGILQAKLAEHKLRYTYQEVERKVRVKNLDGVVPQ